MSERNIPDEELDDLFRKAAESFDPPYDPEAWVAMEDKLDVAQGRHTWFRRSYIYLSMALLLLGVTVVLLLRQEPKVKTEKTEGKTTEIINQETIERKSLPQPRLKNGETEKRATHRSLESTAAAGGDLLKNRDHKKVYKAQVSGDRSNRVRPFDSTADARPSVLEFIPRLENNLVKTLPGVPKLSDSTRSAQAVSIKATAETMQLYPDSASILTQKAKASSTESDSSRQQNEKEEKFFLRSIQLGLVIAPDLTTVKFKNAESISLNGGILVGLPLSRKLSVITGAIWANKLYQATPEDYAPSPGYWDGRHKPSIIKADCNVLDIPLNIRYQLLHWGKNELSIQAGVSSYLMLEEEYTYTYRSGGKDSYSTTWEVTDQNRHWFGIQNLSVGYTRKLSPAISVSAEPFVKIPYKSIGAGNVKLTSAGVFFTVGYNLSLAK